MGSEEAITFREATLQDADGIASTHIASWQVAYKGIMPDRILDGLDISARSQSWQKILTETELPCLIIENDKKIIGFVHLSRSRDPDRNPLQVGEVTAIYLDPGYYRQGYGRLLMNHATQIFISHRLYEIDIWVLEENQPARRFYEKLGFKLDGESKKYGDFALVEIRYTKSIPVPHKI